MNIRKITSMTALISFVLEIVTSIILYIVPHGRVAYWSDWRFWGFSKTQWSDLHINLGVLLLLAIMLHIYYNWSAIIAYLNNKSRKTSLLTGNFITALILSIVFSIGTLYEIPPFSSVLNFSAAIKDRATKTYGEPPYGHAELSSLKVFTGKMKLKVIDSMIKLEKSGIIVKDAEHTLSEIARDNEISPNDIYLAIKPEDKKSANAKIPEEPVMGTGNKTVSLISELYNLNQKRILQILKNNGFTASADMTLKEIGQKYDRNPHDIYQYIYDGVIQSDSE